jgi:(p)ppGpp synthase/HD superfamily hydrolase
MIDIYDIQRYTNYEVDLTLTPEALMEQVYSPAKKYLTESDIELITKAFEFAKHAHE